MNVVVQVLHAFTDQGEGGNPAGLVLEAQRYSHSDKQAIAARAGMSETAFVSPAESADFKLEFFTPNRQIAHCGHATIATFVYLAEQGMISGEHTSKETIDGRREIYLRSGKAYMEQSAPAYTRIGERTPNVSLNDVLACLGVQETDLIAGGHPSVVNTGNSFMIVGLNETGVLRSVKPDLDAIERISDALDLIGVYAFTFETGGTGRDAAARMFAPRYGIPEESATGTAAGPLACYLYDQLQIAKKEFVVEQGRLMTPPLPSVLYVELELNERRIQRLLVGGEARHKGVIELELPGA